jgi:hypothetical protein
LLTVLLLDARLWTLSLVPSSISSVSSVTPCWLAAAGLIEYDTDNFLVSSTILADDKVLRKTFQLFFFFFFLPFSSFPFSFSLVFVFSLVDVVMTVGCWLTCAVLMTTEQYRLQSETAFL